MTHVLTVGPYFYACDECDGDHLVVDLEDAKRFSDKARQEFEPCLDEHFQLTSEDGSVWLVSNTKFITLVAP